MDHSSPDLSPGPSDRVAAMLRAVVSVAPYVGGALVEIINHVIPDMRMQRLEEFFEQVGRRLKSLESILEERQAKPESLDLLEEGMRQAARALSPERIGQIAQVVAEGISDSTRSYLESRRVLKLFEELDDTEVIILASFLWRNQHDPEFQKKHEHILYVNPADANSSLRELDAEAVYEAGRDHLLRLGLLIADGNRPKGVSPLGRLLLRRIGLADEDDL